MLHALCVFITIFPKLLQSYEYQTGICDIYEIVNVI